VRLSGTNTYVIVDGCLPVRNHLAVRDVLRADSALRDEYAAVKRRAGLRARDPRISNMAVNTNRVIEQ
jgi:GrpB-like predicted nucleotidyltransferase (UPF0157 family)